MLGELVGQGVVEILIGKGIGKAGGILAKTKCLCLRGDSLNPYLFEYINKN